MTPSGEGLQLPALAAAAQPVTHAQESKRAFLFSRK
jgi:hypothetical protein